MFKTLVPFSSLLLPLFAGLLSAPRAQASTPAPAPSVKVEYKVSRMQGLFNFVQAVAGDPNQAAGLRHVFERSPFNKADLQNQISIFKELLPLLNRSNFIEERPVPGRYQGRPLKDLYLTQSIFAKDLADWSQRTLGLLPMRQHESLFVVLRKFEPAYQELVWNKSYAELYKHKNALEKMAVQFGLNQLFAKAASFYRANWPDEVPFTIGLYPIPFIEGYQNSSHSHSVGTVEDHGVMIGAREDLEGSFSVIFHEICHSLYDSQSVEFMREISGYFATAPSHYRENAYKWFNEALATAVGNGWAYASVSKGQKLAIWYNDPIIDGFAKEIYPLTQAYVSQGRAMDKSFVEQVIQLFGKRFPESIYLYKDSLNQLTFIHDGSLFKTGEARESLFSRFGIAAFSGSSPLDHPVTIQTAKDDRNALVVVFNGAEQKKLEALIAGVPFLKKHFLTLISLKNRSFFSALDDNARPYIVVRAESKQEFTAALDKMKSQLRIDPKNPVHSF